MRVLELEACWAEIVGTVRWIDDCQQPDMYLRQVDVPGVDTKFIEQHRGVLGDLLELQLAAERINLDAPRSDFTGRYRFRKKPQHVRFRLLSGGGIKLGYRQFSELSVRTNELTAAPPGITAVYVVEMRSLTWRSPLSKVPWWSLAEVMRRPRWNHSPGSPTPTSSTGGDIDTHGFAILNRVRQRFPQTRSMLMDRATLLAHRSHWVTEPSPTDDPLELLNQNEARLYRDLVSNALGQSVRLEQERVRFSALEQALRKGREREGQIFDAHY